MVKLSVIIVNYKVRYFLEQCILSLLSASENISIEIIVIDNHSSDGSKEMLNAKYPDVQVIYNSKNVGFAAANNQGVRKARGEYVLILNPDTVVAEDTLENILEFADQKSNFGALGVKFLDGTGNFLPECKRKVPTVSAVLKKLIGNSTDYYADEIDKNNNASVEILSGAFMLIRLNTFVNIGGFDENYFMYGEDIDLSYNLLINGFQNYYVGSTAIIHYKGESTVANGTGFNHFYGAMIIFYNKYFKTYKLYNMLLKLLVKFLIFYKTNKIHSKDRKKNKGALLYIGKNKSTFNKILQNGQFSESEAATELLGVPVEFDTVIFDNNDISNKNIINYMLRLNQHKISMRILPKGTNFYLGSDNSATQGEYKIFAKGNQD